MTFELDYTNPNLDEAGEEIPEAVIIYWNVNSESLKRGGKR